MIYFSFFPNLVTFLTSLLLHPPLLLSFSFFYLPHLLSYLTSHFLYPSLSLYFFALLIFFSSSEKAIIFMELFNDSLSSEIKNIQEQKRDVFSKSEIDCIFFGVARALHQLHTSPKKIMHRDVKVFFFSEFFNIFKKNPFWFSWNFFIK